MVAEFGGKEVGLGLGAMGLPGVGLAWVNADTALQCLKLARPQPWPQPATTRTVVSFLGSWTPGP